MVLSRILVFPLISENGVRRNPLSVLKTPAVTADLKFVDERLFCAFEGGTMNIFSRITSGGWSITRPTQLSFGSVSIKLHFIHDEDIWLSCGNKLSLVEIDSLAINATHTLSANHESDINQVVKTGVGIWVSFLNSAYIKLYHLETMVNLQEISIGNFVHRIKTEKLWTLSDNTTNLVVTSLAESKGLLWIGTSVGVVLTLPLPRLSDGVPLYRGRPSISLHAHRGPVKFLVPLHCASSTLELNRHSSLRYTLRQRQSRRNIEREKVEMEESQKRRMEEDGKITEVEKVTGGNGNTILDCVPDGGTIQDIGVGGGGPDDSDIGSPRTLDDMESSSSSISSPAFPGAADANCPKVLKNFTGFSGKPAFSYSLRNGSSSLKSDWDKYGGDTETDAIRKGSVDDTAIAVRRKLSFRSELANRIMVTSNTLSRSQMNLSMYTNEVEMYYDYLMEDGTDQEDFDNEAQGHNISGSREGKKEKKDKKERGKVAKDKVGQKNKGDENKSNKILLLKACQESGTDQSEARIDPPSSATSSIQNFSPASETVTATDRVSISGTLVSQSAPVKNVGSGFLRGFGTRATMSRKANTNNAVIVLSGGDGYCDLDMSRSQFKMDDACVQLWLYKY
ncbi:rho guanine nucleotide exchange factor 10 [Plakobranchus ocellatus]|uniref:Rho guanine nucleotide exchange factor 10 n=1 Tax=Plakobranchus ocellatus TaxID=259542 RepID=A0AAV3ZDB1_9GAST|nr:rho guanine nucleotide exchange factor 10 [Plakobranchus ocellatus]